MRADRARKAREALKASEKDQRERQEFERTRKDRLLLVRRRFGNIIRLHNVSVMIAIDTVQVNITHVPHVAHTQPYRRRRHVLRRRTIPSPNKLVHRSPHYRSNGALIPAATECCSCRRIRRSPRGNRRDKPSANWFMADRSYSARIRTPIASRTVFSFRSSRIMGPITETKLFAMCITTWLST